jgi:hypothetical protein
MERWWKKDERNLLQSPMQGLNWRDESYGFLLEMLIDFGFEEDVLDFPD